MFRYLILILFIIVTESWAGIISGYVNNNETGKPMPNANISIRETDKGVSKKEIFDGKLPDKYQMVFFNAGTLKPFEHADLDEFDEGATFAISSYGVVFREEGTYEDACNPMKVRSNWNILPPNITIQAVPSLSVS